MDVSVRTVVRWVLGAIVCVGFFVAFVYVIRTGRPEYVNLMLGALIGSFTTVVGYYFGSSDNPPSGGGGP